MSDEKYGDWRDACGVLSSVLDGRSSEEVIREMRDGLDWDDVAKALTSPAALAAANEAVHRKRGLDGSGEAAVRAAIAATMEGIKRKDVE